MSAIYDNWERLVDAVLKKEELWQLFHQQSRTPSICSQASSFDLRSPPNGLFDFSKPEASSSYRQFLEDAATKLQLLPPRDIEAIGSYMSKKAAEPSNASAINELKYSTELNSYEAACMVDVELQSFDSTLQSRANNVITSLASGVEVHAVSFDSLREVTECLLDMNQEVVKVILDCKKDIWNSQELFELVEDYFNNSLKTMEFYAVLGKCLNRSQDGQLFLLAALEQFEDENGAEERERCAKALEDMKFFRDAGDPFTEDFFRSFEAVHKQQMLMLERLQFKKSKLNKKLKSLHSWRKLSSIIFAPALTAVFIFSVVAAALAAATTISLGSMGRWINSLFKNYENAVKGQKEIINSMFVGTYVTIKDLDCIYVMIYNLKIQIETVLKTADFEISEEGVKFGVQEIKKKLEAFMKNAEELGKQTDKCSRDIRKARTVILQRIIKHLNH